MPVRTPTDDQRSFFRSRPVGSTAMLQSWTQLLFLHWKVSADDIQGRLPPGLFVDCFDGDAFLGVVPFFMKKIRLKGTPSVPWISNFLELNVRTYVFDEAGNPGVWFFSLDCNQPLAVWTARTFFHLPYQHASMKATCLETPSGLVGIEYHSSRRNALSKSASRFNYQLGAEVHYASPGSLEFFLVERYLLFASDRKGQLYRGQVHHTPYPIRAVQVGTCTTDLFTLNQFANPNRPFDHAIGSQGVDVEVFGLQQVSSGS